MKYCTIFFALIALAGCKDIKIPEQPDIITSCLSVCTNSDKYDNDSQEVQSCAEILEANNETCFGD